MKLKHNDPEINTDNPFANCKLGREKYAGILTSIVETYADGFVLALDGKWGTGKSTFVKMWDASLRKAEFQTIYFNAWEHDFENEPLVALIGEMRKLVDKEENNTDFNVLLKKGAVLSKRILPSVVKAFAKRHLGDEATEILGESVGAISDIFEEEVYEYVKKKDGLEEFKEELVQYIEKYNNSKPVVFIIDELDRCRPDYAVEILEKVKHFFTVEGIVFVLSIDKIQLGHSIQGYYGSNKIDTNEYLRRFIDLEYQLPEPDIKTFCNYMFDYYDFQIFFNMSNRSNSDVRYDFMDFAPVLFTKQNYTLRQIEKIFSRTRIILKSFNSNSHIYPELLLLLIHIRDFENKLYIDIKTQNISIQELVLKIESIFVNYIQNSNVSEFNSFIWAEAHLIQFYTNFLNAERHNDKIKLIEKEGDVDKLTFTTKIAEAANQQKLIEYLNRLSNNYNSHRYGLNLLLNKIDLFEKFS